MEESEFRDPDYPVAVIQESRPSPAELSNRLDKACDVLRRGIQAEIDLREQELHIIDQRMWKGRHSLHKLRSKLINQHYSKFDATSDALRQIKNQPHLGNSSMWMSQMTKQTRLHPALRKLTHKTEVCNEELFLAKKLAEQQQPQCSTQKDNVKQEGDQPQKLGQHEADFKKYKKIPRHIEPESSAKVIRLEESTRLRQKHKYRIIIGNTSKYSPGSSPAERCTHKWLLYVRPPDGSHSTIVTAVVVRLHESYAPHHVCHLRTPPFHLSRRGWGEFPARVELHFKMPELNRPATVEHVLKLDKRRSGLQSLGAETIVEVGLYSNQEMLKFAMKVDKIDDKENVGNTIKEKDDQWSEFFSTDTTELDIDEMIIKPKKNIDKTVESSIGALTSQDREVVYKVDDFLQKPPVGLEVMLDEDTPRPINEPDNLENVVKNIKNDHCYIQNFQDNIKSVCPRVKAMKRALDSKVVNLNHIEVVSKMTCIRSAVNYLLSKIPLVARYADEYKNIFPWVVPDAETFWKMNNYRRRNIEWSRAKAVNQILIEHFANKSLVWRTKQILYFARLHGYQPSLQTDGAVWTGEQQWDMYRDFKKRFPNADHINSGTIFDKERFKLSSHATWTLNEFKTVQGDTDIDIDVVDVPEPSEKCQQDSPKKDLKLFPIEDEDERSRCLFVEKTCQDIGIVLNNEDIGNGFCHSAVHRVMVSATRSLVAEMLHAALAESRLQNGTSSLWNIPAGGAVGLHHLYEAIRTHDRFHIFTLDGLCDKPTDYSERL